jgi:hypothetical protein
MQRFKARLEPVPGGGNFVVVPPEIATAAGLKYGVRVRGTVNGVDYRSSLMMYSGVFHMGVHKATMAAAKVAPGANLDVAIEIDDKPLPTDTIPPDLQRALKASKAAQHGWETLSPSHRREHVKAVLDAKKPETRERRIASTIAMLEDRAAKSTKPRVAARATSGGKAPRAQAAPRARASRSRSKRAR